MRADSVERTDMLAEYYIGDLGRNGMTGIVMHVHVSSHKLCSEFAGRI